MRNVSHESWREKRKHTFYVQYIPPPPWKSCRLYDTMKKYGRVMQVTDVNIIRGMSFAWRKPKATNTPSEYVIIISSPWQQSVRERASLLRYKCIACLVQFSRQHIRWDTQSSKLHCTHNLKQNVTRQRDVKSSVFVTWYNEIIKNVMSRSLETHV
jgi:hypothetical protein